MKQYSELQSEHLARLTQEGLARMTSLFGNAEQVRLYLRGEMELTADEAEQKVEKLIELINNFEGLISELLRERQQFSDNSSE